MAIVKIARGTTGQADSLGPSSFVLADETGNGRGWDIQGPYYAEGSSNGGNNLNPDGWSFTESGQVSVPLNSVLGRCDARYSKDLYVNEIGETGADTEYFEFEAVAFTAKLDLTFDPSTGVVTATATAQGNGDGSPYWYEFTAPGLGSNVQRGNTVQFTGGDSATVKISSDDLQDSSTASAQICTATLVSEAVELKGQNVGTGAPRYGNFYQATVDFNTFGAAMQTTFGSTDSDVTIGAPFRGSALARPNQWTVDIQVNFDFEEKQTRTINWQSGDGGACVFGGSMTFDVERGAAPVVCAAGTHDDGTGVCVPEGTDPTAPQSCATGYHDDGTGVCVIDPTGPQPCAAGYTWDGSACLPDVTTGPDGCCLPGYYQAVAGGPCLPVHFTRYLRDCGRGGAVVECRVWHWDKNRGYATRAECEASPNAG